ncbi:MAG: hypothetical protein ACOYN4_11450 [Bacteroidales bacterium]
MNRKQFLESFNNGPVYLKNEAEGAVVRTSPSDKGLLIFVKLKDQPEFEAKDGSSLVADSFAVENIITKFEYDNYR